MAPTSSEHDRGHPADGSADEHQVRPQAVPEPSARGPAGLEVRLVRQAGHHAQERVRRHLRLHHCLHQQRLGSGPGRRLQKTCHGALGRLHRFLRLGHLSAEHRQPLDHMVPAHAGAGRSPDHRTAPHSAGLRGRRIHVLHRGRRQGDRRADQIPRKRQRFLERIQS